MLLGRQAAYKQPSLSPSLAKFPYQSNGEWEIMGGWRKNRWQYAVSTFDVGSSIWLLIDNVFPVVATNR